MKALLISDDDNAISKVSTIVKNEGYDLITYRWFLKALDNVEEIAPDLIIISSDSYPRHWKTLVQYAKNGFNGVVPKVVLFSRNKLEGDELEKSKILNVTGIFSSLDDSGLDDLSLILSGKNKLYQMIFTNPDNGLFITGKIDKYENGLIHFSPDNPKNVSSLKDGTNIKQITFKKGNNVSYIVAKLISKSSSSLKMQVI